MVCPAYKERIKKVKVIIGDTTNTTDFEEEINKFVLDNDIAKITYEVYSYRIIAFIDYWVVK